MYHPNNNVKKTPSAPDAKTVSGPRTYDVSYGGFIERGFLHRVLALGSSSLVAFLGLVAEKQFLDLFHTEIQEPPDQFAAATQRKYTSQSLLSGIKLFDPRTHKARTESAALRHLVNFKTDTNTAKTTVITIFQLLDRILPMIYTKFSGLKGDYARYRKIIATNTLYPFDAGWNIHFGADPTGHKEHDKEQLMLTYLRNKAPLKVSMKVLEEFRDECIQSTDWLYKVFLVQLVTGARFIEVLKVSEFHAAGERDIQIEGVAKSKDGQYEVLPPKPVLWGFNAQKIVNLVEQEIRPNVDLQQQDGSVSDIHQITRRYNPRANAILKDVMPGLTTHGLRKIYANLSHRKYGGGTGVIAWLTDVLGHPMTSVRTSVSYTNVLLVP